MSIRLQHLRDAWSFLSGFTGRTGEVVVDTTNNRLIVHDGVTSGGWPAAKLSEVVTAARTPVSDSNYTAIATDRLIAYTALSAVRTVTLPAASAFPLGVNLSIVDESGMASPVNTITLARSGSDTIDGQTSATVSVPYGSIVLESDGISRWTITSRADGVQTGVYGSSIRLAVLEDLITCAGASSVSSIQIPNRAVVIAVWAFVKTAITGATSYNVDATTNASGGAGMTAGQFGSSLGIAAGSNNAGVIGPTAWYAASTIKLTANGGSFTGGQVRIAIQYMLCGPPTS